MKAFKGKISSFHRLLLVSALISVLIFDTLSAQIGFAKPLSSRLESTQGNVFFVNYSAHGKSNGASWVDAFTNLQSALDIAQPDDEIWVATGTYRPSKRTDAADPRSATFSLTDGVRLYGGFVGNENSLQDRKWMAHPTILSGDIDNNDAANPITDVYQIIGENVYHVVSIFGANAATQIDGFTITAGNTDRDYTNSDCAIYCGGGLLIRGGNPAIANLLIQGNSAGLGGGIAIMEGSSATLLDITLTLNRANRAGGLVIGDSSPKVNRGTINGNSALSDGGGIAIGGTSHPVFTNITVFGNKADHWGGGMFIHTYRAGTASLVHSTFYNNNASGGSELMVAYSSELIIRNSIIWGTDPEEAVIFGYGSFGAVATYSDILTPAGEDIPGVGNINVNPRLGEPGDYGGLTQTIRLLPGSPAVDAVPTDKCTLANGITPLTIDQRGVSRPQRKGCDMGAYEVIFTSYYLPIADQ